MPSRTTLHTLLVGLLASTAAGAACSSGGGGDLSANDPTDGGGTEGGAKDGAADAHSDATSDVTSDVTIVCNPPPPETVNVPMKVEYCYGWQPDPDGGSDSGGDASSDAGDFIATCNVNCMVACQGAFSGVGGMVQCMRVSATEVQCEHRYLCGRAPEGFVSPRVARNLGELFSNYAILEAAAVDAFERMALELEAHAAPSELVRAARRSADDERRHTRMMNGLAQRHGGSATTPACARWTVRSLVEIALENAVEGCVRETFGALLALHQAEHATDRELRRAMKAIAGDEVRHAELSWRVSAWIEPLLSDSDRARVEASRSATFTELASDGELPLWRETGLPAPEHARRLARGLAHALS